MRPPGDKNVTAASGPVREVEGGCRGQGGGGRGGDGRFSLSGGKKGGTEEGKKNPTTITDEKTRCEEGKMLLLEAVFSNRREQSFSPSWSKGQDPPAAESARLTQPTLPFPLATEG